MNINEYNLPKMSSRAFTYRKFPDPDTPNKFRDNGVCEVCGRRGTYTHVYGGWPTMCYKCHQSIRAYRKLMFDPLRLHNRKKLNLKQCKKIVQYMRKYSKAKALAAAAVTAAILTPKR